MEAKNKIIHQGRERALEEVEKDSGKRATIPVKRLSTMLCLIGQCRLSRQALKKEDGHSMRECHFLQWCSH